MQNPITRRKGTVILKMGQFSAEEMRRRANQHDVARRDLSRTTLHPIVWTASDTIGSGVQSCLDVPLRLRRRLYVCMTANSRATDDPAPDPHRPLLVDVLQAANVLAISRSSIYQLIWSGQLTPIRIGRSVRFSVEQLEQFVIDRSAAS